MVSRQIPGNYKEMVTVISSYPGWILMGSSVESRSYAHRAFDENLFESHSILWDLAGSRVI